MNSVVGWALMKDASASELLRRIEKACSVVPVKAALGKVVGEVPCKRLNQRVSASEMCRAVFLILGKLLIISFSSRMGSVSLKTETILWFAQRLYWAYWRSFFFIVC